MIKIKLEKNKYGKIIFKLKIKKELENNILFRRIIIESKIIKGNTRYDYEVPLRFFMPICKNTNKEEIVLDKKSILSYLEFSDFYDENYYTETDATARYMKKWREEGCPNIYRITINENTLDITKEIVFKKPEISLKELEL